ncbi:alpha/beta fold hydrolase [Streptomyces sediminimaris]|uniref:alpha/beta fold hydrolase n=1 Tax=Streptomyces sediminimaris TaxID=3383721 RepID=UPI00399A1856
MSTVTAHGIRLEYDVIGPTSGEPLLVVQGLGDQLTKWDDGFPQALVARGFQVIRFDNRDTGLSTHLDDAPVPDLDLVMAAAAGAPAPAVPYTLDDMARDAVAVLDAVGVEYVHVLGASMGGMIAQLVAAHHADRVLTLTSLMSTTGNRALPLPTPQAIAVLTADAPDPRTDEDAWLEHSVAGARVLGSPGYPHDERRLRGALRAAVRRAHNPAGFLRQLAAISAAPDRRALLRELTVPALVVHGTDDPLLPFAGGQETADTIPGAAFLPLTGMGHHLPPQLYGTLADAVAALAAQARQHRPSSAQAADSR